MESQDSTYLYEHCLLLQFNLVVEILEGEGIVLRGIPGSSPSKKKNHVHNELINPLQREKALFLIGVFYF